MWRFTDESFNLCYRVGVAVRGVVDGVCFLCRYKTAGHGGVAKVHGAAAHKGLGEKSRPAAEPACNLTPQKAVPFGVIATLLTDL